jgi:hypothetical protein
MGRGNIRGRFEKIPGFRYAQPGLHECESRAVFGTQRGPESIARIKRNYFTVRRMSCERTRTASHVSSFEPQGSL